MAATEHEAYAQELLSALTVDQPDTAELTFVPEQGQSRNAAKAMSAILCHRLSKASKERPSVITKTTFAWGGGVFNGRNIADRNLLWTNLRRKVADEIHEYAASRPVAYLLSFSDPRGAALSVWALPEPLLYDSLAHLPLKASGREYTVQIHAERQRIEHYAASPDLTPYHREFVFSDQELRILNEAREVDAATKRNRVTDRGDGIPGSGGVNRPPSVKATICKRLAVAAEQLTTAGAFDPAGITDARRFVFGSIMRRSGQPAFRKQLLMIYSGRCAITGCDLEAVLEAAHIVPYRGRETNRPDNGLLLRADLHTLFDLKLITVDAATMRVVLSPSLAGSYYEQYRDKPLAIPDDPAYTPSRAALEKHRAESGL